MTLDRLLVSGALMAMLSGCPTTVDGDSRLNGGGTGSPDDPVYVVTGSCIGSFMLHGDGNPVGFSVGSASNSEFHVDYKEIGELNGLVISIFADSDFGDNYYSGIGTYDILGDQSLDEDNSVFFEEGYFDSCPDEYEPCLPICEDGQIWGDSLNDKLDRLGGFLLQFYGEGADPGSTYDGKIFTAFPIEGPWGGGDVCTYTEEADRGGDCSNL